MQLKTFRKVLLALSCCSVFPLIYFLGKMVKTMLAG